MPSVPPLNAHGNAGAAANPRASDEVRRAGQQRASVGLTVRDHFAAAALQGYLAAHSGEVQMPPTEDAARWAYQFADAMLDRRATPPA